MSDNTELKNKIESAWENIAKISPKDIDIADAVNEVIKKLDNGQFRIAEKNDARQIKNKKGKVILVKLIATSIFSKSPTKPGAIIETKAGMKISIIIVKNNNPKKRRLKISLANLFDCFFPLVISDE